MPFVTPIAALAIGLMPLAASAHDYALGALRIEHPYARPTPPGARTGGAYFTIRNTGDAGDRLVHISSPVAKSAEVHSMTMEGNLMRMRAMPALDIGAHSTVTLGPGGYHVMLVDLLHPLAPGGSVPLRLTFEKAGAIDVAANVEAATGDAQAPHRH